MRLAMMFLSLVAILVAGAAVAGQLAPGLEAYLIEQHRGGPVKALLVLEDQVDVVTLDLDLHYQRASLADRHAQVITELQDKARTTQGPLLAELDARLGQDIDGYQAYWLINAIVVTGTEDAIRDLAARDDVDVVELDLVAELIEPEKIEAAGEGQTRSIGIAPGIVAVGARRVWDELGVRGEGALIGSLDTGVDGNHPALTARWRGNHAPHEECWLDVLGNGSTTPVDYGGHGTHTTGTMTGLAVNDTIGVSPASEWIAANAIDQGANPGFDNDILDCLQFFADPDGNPFTTDDVPDVVQNSWGVNENFAGYVDCDSRWWGAIDACEAAGVMLCWSAGNEGPNARSMRSPADRATTLYNCFSVGATEHYAPYTIADYSSRGPAGFNCGPVENRIKPEITAPGTNIYSSVPGGGYQGGWNGTSMAGPHVAGVVALMRSANQNVDVLTIKQILIQTANDLGQSGDDNDYGNGFLDAFEAVQAVIGGLGYVEGTVRDEATGDPIEGATITVDVGTQSAVTGADGGYRLVLPPGPVNISVSAFGYVDAVVAVTVVDNQTTDADLLLELAATATVTGTVYAAGSYPGNGTPAPNAIVQITGTPVAPLNADLGGNFTVALPVGTDYTISAGLSGSGAISQQVPVYGDLHVDLYLSELSLDGFETGNLNGMPWVTSGDGEWYVQSSTVHTGSYAAQSGPIGNFEGCSLQVTVDCGVGGDVEFWYKVSSLQYWCYLDFYIDDIPQGSWSGEHPWALHSVPVAGGVHTFRWDYLKDGWFIDGADAVWIDDIDFPDSGTPVPMCVPMPTSLSATVGQDESVTLPLVVMNQGTADLEFDSTTYAWASITDGSATVGANGYHVMQVTMDATGLQLGYHSTNVDITSNDPINGTVNVPLYLTVTDETTPVMDTPQAFRLVGAVPNPFNPQTTIKYALPTTGMTRLRLYDVQGRLVRSLVDDVRPAGAGEVVWDGRDGGGRSMASGTYFARLEQGALTSVKSLVLVR